MNSDEVAVNAADAAVQYALLQRLLDDDARGARCGLVDYQAAFPGHEALIARVLGELAGAASVAFEGRDRIGPYVLVEELGRGGQATVFLARDCRLSRLVALKLLSLSANRIGGARIERFKREALAASRLDHPGICPVYESGEHDGVLFLAMRHVPGETLALHLARAAAESAGATSHLRLPVAPPSSTTSRTGRRRQLDPVLALLEQVARALHVAHEAGIVHRDVKPGNIMVTPTGEPVVLDFGLAHDVGDDGPELTRSDETFGTPAYMAPEQLRPGRERVDRRADIWALGVTLYECLTRRRPFRAVGLVALADVIGSGPTPDPRDVDPTVPVELAVIVATALAPAREQRYATALDFAEDLRAVRELQPIRARPAGSLLRLRRWMQRNQLLAASGLLVFLSLTAGLVVSLLAWQRANREKEHAVEQSAQRREVTEFLRWILSSPDPARMGPRAPLSKVLERADERIRTQFVGQPLVRAQVLQMLGGIHDSLGDTAAAAQALGEAIDLLRQAAPDSEQLVAVLVQHAIAVGDRGASAAEVEALCREALDCALAQQGPTSVDVAAVRFAAFGCRLEQGDRAGAVAVLTELERAAAAGQQQRSFWLRARGKLHVHDGRWDSAMADVEAVLAMPDDPANPRAAYARQQMRLVAMGITARLGDTKKALAVSTEIMAYMRQVLEADDLRLAVACSNHGTLLRMNGHHAEAEEPYLQALAITRGAVVAPHQDLAITINNLGALYRHLQRPDEALPLLEEAAAMFEALHGERHASVAGALDNLADLHAGRGNLASALQLQLRSLSILRQVHGDGHYETLCSFFRTARLQVLADQIDAALANCETALRATAGLEQGGRVRVLNFANQVALAMSDTASAAQAVPIARATVAQVDELAAADPGTRARYHADLAVCLHRAGETEAAAAECGSVRELLVGEGVAAEVKERLLQRIAALGH